MSDMPHAQPTIELLADLNMEYEHGVVHAYLRHAQLPLDPWPGDFIVVGDDDDPALAEVVSRSDDGVLRLRLLPGRPDDNPEFFSRRVPLST